MRQVTLMEKYPVFVLEVAKTETSFTTVDEIVEYLRGCVDKEDKVAFIGVFDHYEHTRSIGGDIEARIQAAKNVVFCFGFALPNPMVMAVRPRSIGVCDVGDGFVISFLEAPMPPANKAMEEWAKGVRNL
ncbi:DUF6858 family protein [Magnetospirillum aberrantis]|uniref:Uncharacterized protein n=1 Tax=Magnetospirillum aberrantis SpK TaxID=908842 RepID=A0A7C9UZE0_9PROT|nr:hypothetical protein [Magnetospirillum aberrantis]NFV80491.1 hypothetical protein [Magnetospirillum aberrantis SpK]